MYNYIIDPKTKQLVNINSKYGNIKFKGPLDEITNVLNILNKYYDGFEAKIQVMQ